MVDTEITKTIKTRLGENGIVFLDGQGDPLLVKERDGGIWFFCWHNDHWIPLYPLKDPAFVLEIPDNLTREQQKKYHVLHRQWESAHRHKMDKNGFWFAGTDIIL